MCGIAGVLDRRRRRDGAATAKLLRTMADQMRFRGPDASGEWVDPSRGIGLGHVRLSIVDLSEHGAQPMVSSHGRWVLTYNGEIYNHNEVAAELFGRGIVFRGHSDRLLGELTPVRDRMGEKPLCYATLPTGEVVLASTLDVLAVTPPSTRPSTPRPWALPFRYKCVPAPFTIYHGVRKLEPGCTVTIRPDGTIGAPEPYWRYFDAGRGPPFDGTSEDAVAHLDTLLRRSVTRRMVADVPVGAFLSGGIAGPRWWPPRRPSPIGLVADHDPIGERAGSPGRDGRAVRRWRRRASRWLQPATCGSPSSGTRWAAFPHRPVGCWAGVCSVCHPSRSTGPR